MCIDDQQRLLPCYPPIIVIPRPPKDLAVLSFIKNAAGLTAKTQGNEENLSTYFRTIHFTYAQAVYSD